MKKMIITGASGFLGWNCCKAAQKTYKVSGIYNFRQIEISGIEQYQCDLCNTHALQKIFIKIKPELVIHTAAISSPNLCEQNPEKSRRVNIEATDTLAGLCLEYQIPFVFTSTDLVFDGNDAPYSEKSSPSPLNEYGRQKLEAEDRILSKYSKSIVCRMPLMYGDSPEGATSFIIPWIEKLHKGEELTLFRDEFRTPVSAQDAASGLFLAAEKGNGIIHLGGKERLSRLEMGKKLIDVSHLNPSLIKACYQSDIKMEAPRPSDVSLDSSKAYLLGYKPGFFKEELCKLDALKTL